MYILQIFSFIIYVFSLLAILSIIYTAFKKSSFGMLLAMYLMWYVIGLYLYPLFNLLDWVEPNIEGISFVAQNGQPGILTAIHILFVSMGMCVGYFARGKYNNKNGFLEKISISLGRVDPIKIGYITVIFSISIILLFYSITGFSTAISSSAAARSGDYSGFEGNEQFMFLKTFSSIAVVATSIFPVALYRKSHLLVFLYLVLITLTYLNSISRTILFSGIVVPAIIFAKFRGISFKSGLILALLIPLGYVVLLYGKPFGQWISSYIEGRDYEIRAYQGDVGFLNAMLTNVSYQWYSVEAGIIHFFKMESSFFPQEIILAFLFGMIPSRILEFFNLGFLYYGNVEASLACINTDIFGLYNANSLINRCTVPTTFFGYSAYLLPIGGGFFAGLIMLRVFSIIEDMWIIREHYDFSKTWIPYFWFLFFSALFSLIPSAIPAAELQLIWVFFITKIIYPKFRR